MYIYMYIFYLMFLISSVRIAEYKRDFVRTKVPIIDKLMLAVLLKRFAVCILRTYFTSFWQ